MSDYEYDVEVSHESEMVVTLQIIARNLAYVLIGICVCASLLGFIALILLLDFMIGR